MSTTKADGDAFLSLNPRKSQLHLRHFSSSSGERDPYTGRMSGTSFKPVKLDTGYITTIAC
jgi:hypothetical protein